MERPYPTARQRDIMQKLMQREWTPIRQLAPAGLATLEHLESKSWIEKRTVSGPASYRITPEGREAFQTIIPLRK
jgi:DNA-binding PadR family transcriptional regulator